MEITYTLKLKETEMQNLREVLSFIISAVEFSEFLDESDKEMVQLFHDLVKIKIEHNELPEKGFQVIRDILYNEDEE